ncbi:hypothetical protein N9493_00415 [Amylibacter sp.]|nr:hypothetical protein [Amylibacter sp.]
MYKDFRQAITDNNIQTLVLDSPGGSVSEGLRIAGTVFDRKIKTYIRKNQNCASACSFIFLSGKTRYTLGKLGVHQIAFDEEFSKKKEEIGLIGEVIQLTNSDIVQYLDENNTPGFVYKYMLRTPSDEMYYFNEDELNQLGNSDISNQDKLHFNRIDNFTKDYNSHLIENKCDTDPNSCNVAQLCTRAAKDGEWRTSLDAVKFVRLAKSKGKRCGVPVPQCPENIKKCNKDYLCTYGTTGTDASLSWLNNPFANEAKLRGLSCGVKKQVLKKTCSQDASSCNNTFLCQKATTSISGQKSWDNRTSWASYVTEAKRRGLACGVSIKPKSCRDDVKRCTSNQLCTRGTRRTNNEVFWMVTSYFKKYSIEAKRRGLSCGVKKQVLKKTCSQDASSCNNTFLCQKATTSISGQKSWDNRTSWASYVIEAKRRGLSCGVIKDQINKKELIKSIQKQLNKLRCNAGAVDGALGAQTFSALERWKAIGGKYDVAIVNSELLYNLERAEKSCNSLVYREKTYNDGSSYKGNFFNGKYNGYGRFIYADGDTYQGNWINDLRHGQGKYTWTNGDIYQGNFKNDNKSGDGKYTWQNGNFYTGNWVNDRRNGYGNFVWPNGEIYQGNWKSDKMHGQGKFTWANGGIYIGNWMNDLMHGQGKYTGPNGKIYQGNWKNGKMLN